MRIKFPKSSHTLVLVLALAGVAVAFYGISGVALTTQPRTPVNLTAEYIDGVITLNPSDPAWGQVSYVDIEVPKVYDITEKLNQPENETGFENISVKVIHNGSDIFFNFRWKDTTKDTSVGDINKFADAVALQVPFSGAAASDGEDIHMGATDNPVNIIFWRADLPKSQNIVGAGEGTVQRTKDSGSLPIRNYSRWSDNNWTVIITRPMTAVSENMTSFQRNSNYSIAWSVWNGDRQERNGRKFASEEWDNLKIE